MFVKTGSTIILSCIITQSASPPDFVFWYHDGTVVNYDSPRGGVRVTTDKGPTTVSRLQITDSKSSDGGDYSCKPSYADFANVTVHIVGVECVCVDAFRSSMSAEQFVGTFSSCTKNPDTLLGPSDENAAKFRELTKSIYDYTKQKIAILPDELKFKYKVKDALDALHLGRFSDDQVWEELQLENRPFLRQAVKAFSRLSVRNDLKIGVNSKPTTTITEVTSECSDDDSNVSDKKKVRFNLPEGPVAKKAKLTNVKGSVVDDKFFILSELEEFLNIEDQKEEDGDLSEEDENDDIDLFEPVAEEANEIAIGRGAMYQDFFDRPRDESIDVISDESGDSESEAEGEEDAADFDDRDVDSDEGDSGPEQSRDFERIFEQEESDSEGELVENVLGRNSDRSMSDQKLPKSDFEKQQEMTQKKIKELEKQSLEGKPWQLAGEAESDRRPENSLLEEHLQFDYVNREAPLITEETTQKLEDIIIQRIKNASFDDVERKVKPSEQPFEFKRRITLDQEKSKSGLAEVYEKEFLKQTQETKVDEENETHKEIRLMTKNLFVQLDALSNFNFTPRPPESEVKMINNLPAISVEETIPMSVSNATLLAPEEVSGKERREVKSQSEKSATDRMRERRMKKANQHAKRIHRESKEKMKQSNPGLGNKYSKLAKIKEMEGAKKSSLKDDDRGREESSKLTRNAFRSSKGFFAKLQDEVHNSVASVKSNSKNRGERHRL
ncbi:U3 small nucleolar ribonucleoprotein MPP10 [Halotydeus destructor]|nr:U3 small nucleolar ribonucleoprotein MPP10 [Halotydeus destructor]